MKKNILITGGAGFIGSHLVRLFVNKYPNYQIINMDILTYAGNLANLKDIEDKENYTFVKCDICDFDKVKKIFEDYKIDNVIHLAAESHVDRASRSILTAPTIAGMCRRVYTVSDHLPIELRVYLYNRACLPI